LGALGAENGGDGVRINGSYQNTPAAWIGLEVGDVILTINDTPLKTVQDYLQAIRDSDDEMRFTLRDVRTGVVQSEIVRLDR
jgi:S1-C subfamily serine protease